LKIVFNFENCSERSGESRNVISRLPSRCKLAVADFRTKRKRERKKESEKGKKKRDKAAVRRENSK